MTEITPVTEAGLKAALADRLKATHVEITDISGMRPPRPLTPAWKYRS